MTVLKPEDAWREVRHPLWIVGGNDDGDAHLMECLEDVEDVGGGGAIAWLAVLNQQTGPPAWWFWTAIPWVVLGLVVVSMSVDLLKGLGDDRASDPLA